MSYQVVSSLQSTSSLHSLMEGFHTEYEVLILHNERAKKHLEELERADADNLFSSFRALYSRVLDTVTDYVAYHKTDIVPYTEKLYEKVETKHDCQHCTGGCDMGHKVVVAGLHQFHKDIQKGMYEVQVAISPLHTHLSSHEVYKQLRHDLYKLQSKSYELIYTMELLLIPTLLDFQKKINARDI